MPSSENLCRRVAGAMAVAVLVAGCSGAADRQDPIGARGPVTCTPAPGSAPADQALLSELRQGIEEGALFTALRGTDPVEGCDVTVEGTRTSLTYRFGAGGTLAVVRDSTIEYTEMDARFSSPPDDPVALLQAVERASFDPDGCGIQWDASQDVESPGDSAGRDQLFRGKICSCQARIRRDTSGAVTGLSFRSAC